MDELSRATPSGYATRKGCDTSLTCLRLQGVRSTPWSSLQLSRVGHSARQPGQEEALESVCGDGGAVLDERAKTEYRTLLGELEAELAEAEEWNDPERASRLERR